MAGLPWLLLTAVLAVDVQMDSVSDEITGGTMRQPTSDQRSGFLSNHLAASLALGEQWLLGGSYTFSLTQGVGISHTPELDATFLVNDHIALTVAVDGTPPTVTYFPICMNTRLGAVCAPVGERLWSAGGMALFTYDSGGKNNFEWSVDGGYSPHAYELRYQVVSGLLAGRSVTENLQQHRFSAGATGHLFQVVDVDLRGAYYVYSGGLDILERPVVQLAGGLPIAPRMFEAAANVSAFFLSRK